MGRVKDSLLTRLDIEHEIEEKMIEKIETICKFDFLDMNELAYWLCFIDTEDKLEKLKFNIKGYGKC